MTIHSCSELSGKADARYYILREGGSTVVPLVPVDQVPFQLHGVPRQWNIREVCEGNWKFVGQTTAPATLLSLSAFPGASPPSPSPPPKFLAPDHYVREQVAKDIFKENRTNSSASMGPQALSPQGSPEPGFWRTASALKMQTTFANNLAPISKKDTQRLSYCVHPSSGIQPDHTKKEYCTHWIKTGECAFVAVGCRYKHEMPSVAKLRELGFTTGVPRWHKEKMAIQSRRPTWMELRMKQLRENGYKAADALREFPDPAGPKNYREERSKVNDTRWRSLKRDCQDAQVGIAQEEHSAIPPSKAHLTNPVPYLLVDVEDKPTQCIPPLSECSSNTSTLSVLSSSVSSNTSTEPTIPGPKRKSSSNKNGCKQQQPATPKDTPATTGPQHVPINTQVKAASATNNAASKKNPGLSISK